MIIQHSDRNVGPANYRTICGTTKLLVTSIFYTIQGEGPYAGLPAIFIRLAGCNRGHKEDMGCQFCDTRFFFDQGKAMEFHDILERIRVLKSKPIFAFAPPMVVITGGEPMLQDNLTEFVSFLHYHEPRRSLQVESNGDRLAVRWDLVADYTSLVVSPKVTAGVYRELKKDVILYSTCLKFVISADPGSPYHRVPSWASNRGSDRVFVSPMTIYRAAVQSDEIASAWDSNLVDHEQTRLNYQYAAIMAMEYSYRMSMQQHLFYVLE